MTDNRNFIYVINPLPDPNAEQIEEWRETKKVMAANVLPIDVSILAENAQDFLSDLSVIFDKLQTTIAGFELDEIEVSAALLASGRLSILGFGGEVGAEGGVKFVFKKRRI